MNRLKSLLHHKPVGCDSCGKELPAGRDWGSRGKGKKVIFICNSCKRKRSMANAEEKEKQTV